jgi:hypothetical protein
VTTIKESGDRLAELKKGLKEAEAEFYKVVKVTHPHALRDLLILNFFSSSTSSHPQLLLILNTSFTSSHVLLLCPHFY